MPNHNPHGPIGRVAVYYCVTPANLVAIAQSLHGTRWRDYGVLVGLYGYGDPLHALYTVGE